MKIYHNYDLFLQARFVFLPTIKYLYRYGTYGSKIPSSKALLLLLFLFYFFRRFRVLERGTKDGYNTAVVEFLRDEAPLDQHLEGIPIHFHILFLCCCFSKNYFTELATVFCHRYYSGKSSS
jgi:hypothetical protein